MKPPHFSTLKKPLVWVSITIFLINQVIERVLNIHIPYVHAYLDDLLVMPIILGLITQFFQWIHPAKQYYHLSKTHIIIAVLFFSVVFEMIYPVIYPQNYTADPIDVICYGLGGFCFYWLVSRRVKKAWVLFCRKQDS